MPCRVHSVAQVGWEIAALARGNSASDTIWLRDYVIFILPAHRSGLGRVS